MGLFSYYDKPGRGVSKDAPRKKGFFRYFEMFFRKFMKLIGLNIMYFTCSIPMMIIYYILYTFILSGLFGTFFKTPMASSEILTFQSIITLFFTIISIIIIGSGPASAAAAFVMRNYSKEEHVWLLSDFFDKIRENFVQGILVSIIDIFVIVIGFISVIFYYNQYISSGFSIIWFIIMWVIILGLVLYAFMHCYIYQLMVTFKNNIFQLFKNALILTTGSIIPFILLSLPVVIYSYFLCNVPFLLILITFLFGITYLRFPFEFYVANSIQKKILNNLSDDTNNKDEYNSTTDETSTNGSDL